MKLTSKEHEIIFDKEFLITKVEAINKIQLLFEDVRISLQKVIEQSSFKFPDYVDMQYGKIFKGENYLSLPYVNLDFPKYFSNDNIFSFRTMFWWGNYFSSTIHLQGKSLDLYKPIIRKNLFNNLNDKVYICVNDSPWEYHLNSDNYILLSDFNIDSFSNLKFLKISKIFQLNDYEILPQLVSVFLNQILTTLSIKNND